MREDGDRHLNIAIVGFKKKKINNSLFIYYNCPGHFLGNSLFVYYNRDARGSDRVVKS